jgi:hypothetical protein
MLLLLQQLATSVCSAFYYLAYDMGVACINGDVQHFEGGESHNAEVMQSDAATAVVTAVAQAMVQHPAAQDLQVSNTLHMQLHVFALPCSRACTFTATDCALQ